MELKSNGKLNFVIGQWRPINENFKGGGHLAMHKLAYKLAERDQNVYICCEPYFKHENITQLICESYINEKGVDMFTVPRITYNHNNTISVYTQVTWNNPFNTRNVARWFMYDSDIKIEETFGNDDCYFNYNNFKLKHNNRLKGDLTVYNFNKNKLWDMGKKRKGYCHIEHKKLTKNSEQFFKNYESTDLTNWRENGGFDFLREEFNKHEYYLTFDDVSYFSIAAVMCGCKVVIIPNEKNKYKNALQFRKENYAQSVGISYGFDDLEWSILTKGYINNHINELEYLADKTVDDFVEFWKKRLKL